MPHVQRAQRFNVSMPVLWRPRGATEWHEGTSLNASQSGVLIQGDRGGAPGIELEVIFGLSWHIVDQVDLADVMCFARIVRMEESQAVPGTLLIGARIESYAFIRSMQQI